jgi:hypothetical protein
MQHKFRKHFDEHTYLGNWGDKLNQFGSGFLGTFLEEEGLWNIEQCAIDKELSKLEINQGFMQVFFEHGLENKYEGFIRAVQGIQDKPNVEKECHEAFKEDQDILKAIAHQILNSNMFWTRRDFWRQTRSQVKPLRKAMAYEEAGQEFA